MFCSNCGIPCNDGDSFCPNCGNALGFYVRPAQQYNGYNMGGYFSRHDPNIPGIVVSVLLFVTAFLPVFKMFGASVSFIDFSAIGVTKSFVNNIGIYIILIAVVALVMSIFDINIGVSICGWVSLALFLYVFFRQASDIDLAEYVKFLIEICGIGFHAFWILSIALLVAGRIGRQRTPKYMLTRSENDYRFTPPSAKVDIRGTIKTNSWKCNKCGKENPYYTGTCSCGNDKTGLNYSLNPGVTNSSNNNNNNSSNNKSLGGQMIRCPSCGRSVSISADVCPYCNAKMIKMG